VNSAAQRGLYSVGAADPVAGLPRDRQVKESAVVLHVVPPGRRKARNVFEKCRRTRSIGVNLYLAR